MRSRKRRRAEGPSWKSRSMSGVTQSTVRWRASSAWLRAGLPSMRTSRRAAAGSVSGSRPVPISSAALRRRDGRRDRPRGRSIRPAPAHLLEPRPAQAAARGEEGECLEQIGLAGPVGPGQHHRARIELEPQGRIGAEIVEHQPPHREWHGHRGWRGDRGWRGHRGWHGHGGCRRHRGARSTLREAMACRVPHTRIGIST